MPRERYQRRAAPNALDQPSWATHLLPCSCHTPVLPLHGRSPNNQKFRNDGQKDMSTGYTHRLSSKALTQYSRILLNQEVVNGICITESSGRLRKRPASNLEDDNSQTTDNSIISKRIIPELVNEWPAWRSIVFVGGESKMFSTKRCGPLKARRLHCI